MQPMMWKSHARAKLSGSTWPCLKWIRMWIRALACISDGLVLWGESAFTLYTLHNCVIASVHQWYSLAVQRHLMHET